MPTPTKITKLAFPWGDIDHPVRSLKVDDEFYQQLREGFQKLADEGYYAPVVRQHQPDDREGDVDPKPIDNEDNPLEDGFAYGLITDVLSRDEGIFYEMQVTDRLAEAIDAGEIPYWSPGVYMDWNHPNTGETLRLAPRHHSFVTVPHQKNLTPATDFYDLEESPLEGEYVQHSSGLILQESTMTDELQQIMDRLDNIEDSLEPDEEPEGDPEPDEEPDSEPEPEGEPEPDEEPESSELAEHQRRIQQLENRQIRDTIREFGIDDDETVDDIVQMSEVDRVDAFALLADAVRNASDGTTVRMREIGSTGETKPSSRGQHLDMSEALEVAGDRLEGSDDYESASKSDRAKMRVKKAKELRGE